MGAVRAGRVAAAPVGPGPHCRCRGCGPPSGCVHTVAPSSRRCSAFEVLALDGVSTGILQFRSAQEGAAWLRAVSANIRDLTLQSVSRRPVI